MNERGNQVYISQEVKVFSNSDAKEFIQELKPISKMLQSLQNSLKNR
jgi:hypothetical protein